MPDETGMETTRSEALSVDESLFGDAADDPEAAVADEQDTAEEAQGPDAAGEQAGAPEDLKVVVSIKGGRATIGVQRPASDPHIESFDDADLSRLNQEIPAVIERARASGRTNRSIPLTSDLLPRRGVGTGVSRGRRRPGPPKERRSNSSNPRR